MKCGDAKARDAFPREGFLAGQPGTEWEEPDYQEKSPGQGAGDWKSHFNSSYCMTLNQPFLWLSLFPIWTMMWLDQLISKALPVLTPYLHTLKGQRDSIVRERHPLVDQGPRQSSLPGYEHMSPETVT